MSSNFPSGFASTTTIRGIPLRQMHPGEVFWVNNSTVVPKGGRKGSNSYNGSFLTPFSTITYALTQCRANRGDIIMLGIGHNDSLAAGGAGALTLNVAGVAIVGTGVGSLRSAITFTGTTDTVVISAANMSFSNLSFEAGVAQVATGLDIGAVDGLSFDNCYFLAAGGAPDTLNYVDVINLETGADDISFNKCKFFGRDTLNDQFIVGVAHDGLYIDDCLFLQVVAQDSTVPLIEFTGAVTNIEIKNSSFYHNLQDGLFIIGSSGTNSGVIADCMFGGADTADSETLGVDLTGAHAFECYFSGAVGGWGIAGGGATAIYNSGA